MSKTVTELGMIGVGIALMTVPGLQMAGVIAIAGHATLLSSMFGIGLSTTLSGVGLALRQTPLPVGTNGTLTFQNGVAPRRVIYGRFQTAGVLTYASFPPNQNLNLQSQFLHLIYTLAAHEILSFDSVVINGTPYAFGTDIQKDSTLPNTPWQVHPQPGLGADDLYWQHIFFEFDYGSPASTGQPFPNLAASDSAWTSAFMQKGCAKVHVILRYDNSWTALYPNGLIPNIQFLVTGKPLTDPRVVTAWQPSTSYLKYQWFEDGRGIVWVQTNTSGTSSVAASRPNFEGSGSSWPVTLSDNTLSWTTWGQGMTAIQTRQNQNLVGCQLKNEVWQPTAGFTQNTIIEAPLGYLQQQTASSGSSGSTEPTWSTTLGGTTTDGTQAWVCLGRSPSAINPSNSALVVSDYLQDPNYGMDAPVSSIDFTSVIAAANVCDEQELIIWNADGSVVYENLYTTNGQFDYSSVRGNVLTALCGAMAGWVVPPGDLWHVFAGAYVSPTIALGDNDLRGTIKGDFRLSRRDVANGVKGKYIPAFLPTNPGGALSLTQIPGTWQSQSFPAYQANGMAGKPNYLNTEDGGQIIWQDIQLDFTTSVWTAQRLAKITLMRLRFQQTLTLPCKLTAFELEAGDTFAFTHERWDMIGAVFEVTQCSITFDTSGKDNAPVAGVDLTVRQTDPSIYTFTAPSSATNYGEYSPYGITGIMTGVE